MPGLFERRYTDAQRAALYRLKTHHRLSGTELARAAAAGIAGLEPFHVPRDTANRICKEEARRRLELEQTPVATLAESDPRAAVRELVRQLAALAGAELERLRTRPPNRPPRPAELAELARVLERMESATRRLEPASRAGSSAPAGAELEPDDAPAGFLAELAAEDATPPLVTSNPNNHDHARDHARSSATATARAGADDADRSDDAGGDVPALPTPPTRPRALVPELEPHL